ncbi:MAG: hypothetical protein HRT63_02280 [Erythrobacter sp.]|nr:hypothetical protein [Erythrobacter sp.]
MSDAPFDFNNLYAEENAAMQAFLADKGALGLYHCGSSLNWDFARPTIEWLIAHPECPKAIASNIFWKSITFSLSLHFLDMCAQSLTKPQCMQIFDLSTKLSPQPSD